MEGTMKEVEQKLDILKEIDEMLSLMKEGLDE